MKKILLLFLPLALLIGSCKKEYITPNRTIIININSGQWVPLNGGRSYTTAINLPELDEYMNERGGVLVYLSFGDRTYEQIPQLYNGDSYSYVTRPGQIVLEVQEYDGLGTVSPPPGMTVKIVLMESDF